MDFNLHILADQIIQYAKFTGSNIGRKNTGSIAYRIDNYVLNGNRISLHYAIASEGEEHLKALEVREL